jgi:type I restriction enzyme S subunit
MEVRPGYKWTELGVIPEEWETDSMLRISRQIMDYRGRTPKKLGMDWGGGDIPALSAGNVKKGFVDFKQECYFGSEALYNRWMTRGNVEQDDILFTTEAPLGNVALVPDNRKYILSQRTVLIQVDPLRVLSRFLFHMMLSDGFQRMLADYSSGSTAKGIKRKKFEQLCVALPSLSEQRTIAAALSDVDALLGGLERLIAKKRDLKQAAMQQLLTGQTRLPGFCGEWDKVRLGDLFNFKNGLNKAKGFFGYGTPIVNYMDVFRNSAISVLNLEGRVSLTNPELKTFDVKKGDVFFTRTSETTEEIGIASVILDEPTNTVFSGFLLRARPLDGRLSDEFKAYCFRSAFVRKQIISKASYTTRALTNGKILSEVLLPLPTIREQTAIAAVLSDMDAELLALEARRDKTRALKQAMMQELLTGKTRLVTPSSNAITSDAE